MCPRRYRRINVRNNDWTGCEIISNLRLFSVKCWDQNSGVNRRGSMEEVNAENLFRNNEYF